MTNVLLSLKLCRLSYLVVAIFVSFPIVDHDLQKYRYFHTLYAYVVIDVSLQCTMDKMVSNIL